jgi:ATP-dependent exoDNAse (exonuclease V) alpha subunit
MKDIQKGSLYIAATNQLVDIHNAKELVKAKGETRHYRSIDEPGSDMRVLNAISGCKQKLSLKVNAPVIITMNVAGKAANGQRGNIKAMGDDSITVNLINGDVISLERMPFSRKFSNSLHTHVQFPIKLAWGITVHRCQGQTLSSAVIDFRRVYSSTM